MKKARKSALFLSAVLGVCLLMGHSLALPAAQKPGAEKIASASMTDIDLQIAISTTPAGGSVTLANDIEFTGTLLISKSVTIEGNGHVLSLSPTASTRHFSLSGEGANIVFKNLTISGNGTNPGGGIMSVASSLSLENVTLRDCQAVDGGAIFVQGDLLVDGGEISGNTADGSGGGIYSLGNGTIILAANAKIDNNTATRDGGGIYVASVGAGQESTVIISDNSVMRANRASNGGGIYGGTNCAITLSGSAMVGGPDLADGNAATENGGGILSALGSGPLKVTANALVGHNTATNYGGGIGAGGVLEVSGNARIINNNAGVRGGGIYYFAPSNSATLYGGDVSGNASADGAGIYFNSNYNTLKVTDASIHNNTATGKGGGVFGAAYGLLDINQTTVTENVAADGGGIWAERLNDLTTDAVTFRDNRADIGYEWTIGSDPDSLMHNANIKNTTYTYPFTNAYNNYDVGYVRDGEEHVPVFITLRYDPNGATSGDVPASAKQYVQGETVDVLGNTGSLAKTGDNTFDGWNTRADGMGTQYAPGDKLVIGAQDVTLYAQWIRTNPRTGDSAPEIWPLSLLGIGVMALVLLTRSKARK